MAKNKRVSVRQRRVSAELRTLRVAAGLTCLDVAKALDCSESKISRMETGDRGLFADDVSAILGFLRAPAALRASCWRWSGRARNATGTRSTASCHRTGRT